MKRKKSLYRWIRENRELIDPVIQKANGVNYRINDEDRRQWALNDEGLYLTARSENVNVD